MVRGELQILVCVGGLSVDVYVKGSIVLAVEECVPELKELAEEPQATAFIPYVAGLSKDVRRVCRRDNI